MTADRFVLDTNVVIQLLRGRAIGQQIDARFRLLAAPTTPMISAVSLGEARSLARQWGWTAERVARLHELLSRLIVVDIRSEPILRFYAEIDHLSKDAGRKMNPNDVWIAATSAATAATLLTTDKDFDHLDSSTVQRIWIDPQNPAGS